MATSFHREGCQSLDTEVTGAAKQQAGLFDSRTATFTAGPGKRLGMGFSCVPTGLKHPSFPLPSTQGQRGAPAPSHPGPPGASRFASNLARSCSQQRAHLPFPPQLQPFSWVFFSLFLSVALALSLILKKKHTITKHILYSL